MIRVKTVIAVLLPLLAVLSSVAANPVYNVRDLGATGNKDDDATAVIQRAIDSAAVVAGTVIIPKGEYRSLPLRLYSNVTLKIEAGATLYADIKNPLFRGGAFISAEKCDNITITGKGTIDGQAVYVYENVRGGDPEITGAMEIARAAGIEMKRYYRAPGYAAAFNLLMRACTDLTIEGITFVNSSLWCMRISGCNRVNIRNVNVFSSLEKGVNSDGIDIDGSANVHITSSNIATGDDAICIKSGIWKRGGQSKIHVAENIIVDNCILSSSSAALKLGTESHGDMRNIIFTNCVVVNSNKGIEINVQDGANVSDVLVSNITMDLKRRHWNWWGDAQVFNLVLKKRRDSSREGSIRNVRISDIVAHAQGTSRITSLLKTPVEDFTLSNVKIFMEAESTPDKRTSDAMQFKNVSGLKVKDVEIYWAEDNTEPKWKSALVLEKVNGFELQGLKVRQAFFPSAVPAVTVVNCTGGIIFNCIAQQHTGTFFHFSGNRTSNITFEKNFTSNAAKPVTIAGNVKPGTIIH